MMKKVLLVIITIFALLFAFFSCERMFDNPYDANSNKETWAPDSVDYFVISANECELSWKLDEDRIDGFKIDKFENNNWITNYAVIGKESRIWQDYNYIYDANKHVKYRIFAYAGQNQSMVKELSVNPELPITAIGSVYNILQNGVTCEIDFLSTGNTKILYYGACWSKINMPDTSDNKVVFSDFQASELDSNIVIVVNNLQPATTYQIRSFAANFLGINYCAEYSFTTDFPNCGTLVDARDGSNYKTVMIGSQCWMAENLRYLPSVASTNVASQNDPLYYVYGYTGNDVEEAKTTFNYNTYGVLYNIKAAYESCPDGWHFPSVSEWRTLLLFLDDKDITNGAGKLKETGTTHWKSPNTGATNETGFTALPGGMKDGYWGNPEYIGEICFFWAYDYDTYRYVSLSYNDSTIDTFFPSMNSAAGLSLRCIKD